MWTALGTFFLAIGAVGVLLPILPTTPFLLLAAACYLRGSPRMHRWMMTNRYFGRYLNDYMEGRGISRKAKVASLVFLWTVISLSALIATESLVIRLVLLAVAVAVTIHIITVGTHRRQKSDQGDARGLS